MLKHNRFSKLFLSMLLILTLVLSAPLTALSHSGRTDANGGHKDNKNASGLGSYHYHHGQGPHLHPNGVCPYSTTSSSTSSSSTKKVVSTATNKAAQEKLKELGYYTGDVDGSFGPKSQEALKAFQEENDLEVDGKLGPKSKKALDIE